MDKKPSLVFFGNEVFATGVSSSAPVFLALIDAGYDIKALVLSQGKVTSRSYEEPAVVKIANNHGIPVIYDLDEVAKIDAQAGILAAYGRILPESMLSAFPSGIINIHPSLLPKYRGPTPIETAILDGASETGVSIIRLSAKMDAGPIYIQVQKSLNGSETKQELADRLAELASHLLIDNLPAILSSELQPNEQTETAATVTKRLQKSDGQVDWSKPAAQIEREIRAYAGWPKSRANIHKHDVILTKVKVVKSVDDGMLVQETGDGWLEIQELITPNGRSVSGSDFLRGYVRN